MNATQFPIETLIFFQSMALVLFSAHGSLWEADRSDEAAAQKMHKSTSNDPLFFGSSQIPFSAPALAGRLIHEER